MTMAAVSVFQHWIPKIQLWYFSLLKFMIVAGRIALCDAQEHRSTCWRGVFDSFLDSRIEGEGLGGGSWVDQREAPGGVFQYGFLGHRCGTTSWAILVAPETLRRGVARMGSCHGDGHGHEQNGLRWEAFAGPQIATQRARHSGPCWGLPPFPDIQEALDLTDPTDLMQSITINHLDTFLSCSPDASISPDGKICQSKLFNCGLAVVRGCKGCRSADFRGLWGRDGAVDAETQGEGKAHSHCSGLLDVMGMKGNYPLVMSK